MHNQNYSDGQEIPLGLSMAMAQNPLAFDYFARLSTEQKQSIINSSKKVHSKTEMKQFTDLMAHNEMPGNYYNQFRN